MNDNKLMLNDYRFFVFGLYPPEQKFTITITIEQLAYSRKDGEDVWTILSSLEIGPHKRIAKSEDFFVSRNKYFPCERIIKILILYCHL